MGHTNGNRVHPAPPEAIVELSPKHDHVISLCARGEICQDNGGSSKLGRVLREVSEATVEPGDVVEIHLDDVESIDSSAIAALIKGKETASKHQGDVRIAEASPRVQKTLEVTGLATVFGL